MIRDGCQDVVIELLVPPSSYFLVGYYQVVLDYIESLEGILPKGCKNYRIGVVVGPRLGTMAQVEAKLQATFPDAAVFETRLAHSQTRSTTLSGGPNKKQFREGPTDWFITAIHPAPGPIWLDGKRHQSRKPIVSVLGDHLLPIDTGCFT